MEMQDVLNALFELFDDFTFIFEHFGDIIFTRSKQCGLNRSKFMSSCVHEEKKN